MDKRLLLLVAAGIFVLATGKIAQILEEDPDYFAHPAKSDGYLSAAGMEPQIELIREIADDHGWEVVCEGTSGEMTTLALGPTWWPWRSNPQTVSEVIFVVATGGGTTRNAPEDPNCGYSGGFGEPKSWHDESRDIPIAIAPADEVGPYLAIARACGFAQARTAPLAAEDRAFLLDNGWDAYPEDWLAVYIGADEYERGGPMMCAGTMIGRYDAENSN